MSLEHLTGPGSSAKRKSKHGDRGQDRRAGRRPRGSGRVATLHPVYAQVAKLNPVPVPAGVR